MLAVCPCHVDALKQNHRARATACVRFAGVGAKPIADGGLGTLAPPMRTWDEARRPVVGAELVDHENEAEHWPRV